MIEILTKTLEVFKQIDKTNLLDVRVDDILFEEQSKILKQAQAALESFSSLLKVFEKTEFTKLNVERFFGYIYSDLMGFADCVTRIDELLLHISGITATTNQQQTGITNTRNIDLELVSQLLKTLEIFRKINNSTVVIEKLPDDLFEIQAKKINDFQEKLKAYNAMLEQFLQVEQTKKTMQEFLSKAHDALMSFIEYFYQFNELLVDVLRKVPASK